MLWLAGFVSLSVIGLLLADHSRDDDACLLALALCAMSGFAGLCWAANAMYAVPLLDWAIACASFVMWDVRRATWLRSFVALAAARLAIHVGIAFAPAASLWLFYHLLNAAFVAQVFIISKQGGIRLGRDVLSGLRGLRVAVPSKAHLGHG